MNFLNSIPRITIFVIIILAVLVVFFIIIRYFLKGTKKNIAVDKFDDLYLKIKEEIKFAVAPKFIQLSLGVNELVDVAIEIWRIEQRLAKSASVLPENQKKGLDNSVQKLRRYVEKYDIEIIDYTNQKFNEGLNLDILSVEQNPLLQWPTVKETIEPTIILKGQVVRKAKIILVKN